MNITFLVDIHTTSETSGDPPSILVDQHRVRLQQEIRSSRPLDPLLIPQRVDKALVGINVVCEVPAADDGLPSDEGGDVSLELRGEVGGVSAGLLALASDPEDFDVSQGDYGVRAHASDDEVEG